MMDFKPKEKPPVSGQCPYRKTHEYDDEGLCLHCYAERPHEHWFEGTVGDPVMRCKCGAEMPVTGQLDSLYSIPVPYRGLFWSPVSNQQQLQKTLDDALKDLARQLDQSLNGQGTP